MWVHRGAAGIEARAPAKLNLFFEVLGRRADGYHEIESLLVPISLYDTLILADVPPSEGRPGASARPLTLTCRWAGALGATVGLPNRAFCGTAGQASSGTEPIPDEQLPQGPDNIVVRAVELLRRRSGTDHGASIQLIKRVPLAAGLGGGSSDAAAALVAANLAWGLGWSRERLSELAAELGSDVPFFLGSGPAVCRGRGERVEPVWGLGDFHAVVVRPPVGLSTAAVYARCRPAPQPESPQPLCKALSAGRAGAAGRLLRNRLEPAAAELSPWIARLESEFARVDCLGHRMTGSGSSYFGLCRHAAHARRVAGQLAARGIGSVYAVRRAC